MEMRPVSQVTWGRLLDLTRTTHATPERRELLAQLSAAYRSPVFQVLCTVHSLSEEDATRAADGIFAALGEQGSLDEVESELGSFRRLLRRRVSQLPSAPDSAGTTAEACFDREWLRCVVKEAMEQMRSSLVKQHREREFEAFWFHEVEMAGRAERTLAATAAHLGIGAEAADSLLAAARKEWRTAVRVVVLGTVSSPEALDPEINSLFGGPHSWEEVTQRVQKTPTE